MGLDYAFEHVLHLTHALRLVVQYAFPDVALAKGRLLVRVLDEPVDAPGQVPGHCLPAAAGIGRGL